MADKYLKEEMKECKFRPETSAIKKLEALRSLLGIRRSLGDRNRRRLKDGWSKKWRRRLRRKRLIGLLW